MSTSLLTRLREFGSMPPADNATLLAAWHPRPANEGEWLTVPNAVCEKLFFVTQGVLRIADCTGPQETTYSFRTQSQLRAVGARHGF